MSQNKLTELLHIYNQDFYLPALVEVSQPDAVKVLVLSAANDLVPESRELLSRMLKACQLNENDYLVQPVAQEEILATITRFRPEFVLLFGLLLRSESFQSLKEKYKPFRFADRKFLLCDTLGEIAGSPALKSALWTQGLKPLFNIS